MERLSLGSRVIINETYIDENSLIKDILVFAFKFDSGMTLPGCFKYAELSDHLHRNHVKVNR